MKALLTFIVIIFISQIASAGVMKDFDSLGGNDVLMERAKALQPDKKVSIVQKRLIDRRWRHEINTGYSNVLGGEAFLSTQMITANYQLHIHPYVSVGLGYYQAFNELSKEGRFLIDQDNLIPDVDEIREGQEVTLMGYPMYGKVNLLNMGIVHFDFYALASYGNITLKSGITDSWSVGGGIGMWFSQYITGRIEIRERFFQAQRFDSTVDMDITAASFSLGVLL